MVDKLNYSHQYAAEYQKIALIARGKADELRSGLPALPSRQELEPVEGLMYARDQRLIAAAKRHQERFGIAQNHGSEHLEEVAVMGTYAALVECNERAITGSLQDQILQRTWRLGIVHDLERRRGFGRIHALEGSRAAEQILSELEIEDPYLVRQVLLHDDMDIKPRNLPEYDIPLFSVFAADHLKWGQEWEEAKWKELENKNVAPFDGVSDYKFLYKLLNSPNLLHTKFGKEVVIPYVQFGIEIARHVESLFNNSKN